MSEIRIGPFEPQDEEAALLLERQCVQGNPFKLTFVRPSFRARSEVYDRYRLLCARVGRRIVGIVGGALKEVSLRERTIRALYLYDLRVHPDYREKGIARRLCEAVLEEIGEDADCCYTLVAGGNQRALGLACLSFDARTVLPLQYAVLPVYRKRRERCPVRTVSAREAHDLYLRLNPNAVFVPPHLDSKLLGYQTSLTVGKPLLGGASIWSNARLLAEQVVELPVGYRILGALGSLLHPWVKLPSIPKAGEIIRSWFLFDLCASNVEALKGLLAAAGNLALSQERTFLYALLQETDPMLPMLKKTGHRMYTIPYFFLAKGRLTPAPNEKVYLDIRDL